MITMNDHIEHELVEIINSNGYAIIHDVLDNGERVAYTVGLFTNPLFEYELIIIGAPHVIATTLLTGIVKVVMTDGEPLVLGKDARWSTTPISFEKVQPCGDDHAAKYASEYFGFTVPLVQITPDVV